MIPLATRPRLSIRAGGGRDAKAAADASIKSLEGITGDNFSLKETFVISDVVAATTLPKWPLRDRGSRYTGPI